jgi:hypothetical protein
MVEKRTRRHVELGYSNDVITIAAAYLYSPQSNLRRFLAYNTPEVEVGGVYAWSVGVKSGARGNKG